MNNWPVKKLGDVCKIYQPKTITSKEIKSEGPYKVYGANGVIGFFDQYNHENSEVAVTCRGATCGTINKTVPKSWITGNAMIVSPIENSELDKDFLFYALQGNNIKTTISGTAQPQITRQKLSPFEIMVPPLAEQKRIVGKLEKLLGKIKEAEKLRAEALESTQSLLPSELHKIFSEGKEKGWEEKELGEICEINPKKSELNNKSDDLLVSFVPMSAVDEHLQTIISLDKKSLGNVKKGYTYFINKDVLFAKITPCMENGKIAIAKNLKNGIGFGTTEFHVIRAKSNVLPEWIYYILRQPFFRDIAKGKMTGSAGQKRVPVQFIENYQIPVPPLSEQKKIVAHLDKLSEKVNELKKLQLSTSADLSALSQSILHQAFEGKL